MKGSVKELTPEEAAERGCLGTLKSLHRRGHVTFDEDLCALAAQGGHLEVLKWLHENGYPWNEDTCELAARHGHLGVLQWARANGCPWDGWTCKYAARNAHSKLLSWAQANGAPKF